MKKPSEEMAVLATTGANYLARDAGIYIMRLFGDATAMGRMHGRFVHDICGSKPAEYYYQLLPKVLRHNLSPAWLQPAAGGLARFLYSLFRCMNWRRMREPLEQHMQGFAEVVPLQRKVAKKLLLFPDIFHFLAGKDQRYQSGSYGCSAFFAHDKATQSGEMLLGRNFDFFGPELSGFQAIKIFHPSGRQPYLWIGSLGIPVGGFGMNRAGICIMPFTNFNRATSLRGRPMFVLMNHVLADCATFDEAFDLLTNSLRCGGYSMLLVDTHTKRAAVIGFSSKKCEIIYPQEGILVRTNHLIDPAMKRNEVIHPLWERHSSARYDRIRQLLEERYGRLTARDAAEIMSDGYDPFSGRSSLGGNLVSASNNALSVVLDPEQDALYLADGRIPVCRSGKYRGYRISSLFETGLPEQLPLLEGNRLSVMDSQALQKYTDAWEHYFDYFDPEQALVDTADKAYLAVEDPVLLRMRAALFLKSDRYPEAANLFSKAGQLYQNCRAEQAECWLWQARAESLAGQREVALATYEKILDIDDQSLEIWKKIAAKEIRHPFYKRRLRGTRIEFITGHILS